MALDDPQGVARHVFTGDVPCIAIAAPRAAHANAFALTERIKTQAHMFANQAPAGLPDRAGAVGQIARQKLPERPLTNKADSGGVLLGGIWKADPTGDLPNDRLWQVSHREQGSRKLGLIEPMKKITLIFSGIQTPQELPDVCALSLPDPGVMAGRNPLGAQHQGMIEKCPKLDFGITQNIGIGGPARLVFAQEFGEHAILVLSGKINGFEGYARAICCACSINQILTGRTILSVIIILPVFHEETDDVPAGLLEHPRRNRRVHTAR